MMSSTCFPGCWCSWVGQKHSLQCPDCGHGFLQRSPTLFHSPPRSQTHGGFLFPVSSLCLDKLWPSPAYHRAHRKVANAQDGGMTKQNIFLYFPKLGCGPRACTEAGSLPALKWQQMFSISHTAPPNPLQTFPRRWQSIPLESCWGLLHIRISRQPATTPCMLGGTGNSQQTQLESVIWNSWQDK